MLSLITFTENKVVDRVNMVVLLGNHLYILFGSIYCEIVSKLLLMMMLAQCFFWGR